MYELVIFFYVKIQLGEVLKPDQDPDLDKSALGLLPRSGSALRSGFGSALKPMRIHNTAIRTARQSSDPDGLRHHHPPPRGSGSLVFVKDPEKSRRPERQEATKKADATSICITEQESYNYTS